MAAESRISASFRAERTWLKIQRNPVSIVMTVPRTIAADGTVTPESQLPAQVVRIASDSRVSIVEGVAGQAPERHVVIFGVVGHPSESVPDNDMAEGYTFVWENDTYRITDVVAVPGALQALAIATG